MGEKRKHHAALLVEPCFLRGASGSKPPELARASRAPDTAPVARALRARAVSPGWHSAPEAETEKLHKNGGHVLVTGA